MRSVFCLSFLATMLALVCSAQATNSASSVALEERIAYQQGQFAGLYEKCGSGKDRAVIGGSIAAWRSETFAGYKGTAEERKRLEQAFDAASRDVAADTGACLEWNKQAAATWRSIAQLVRYGEPVVLKRPVATR